MSNFSAETHLEIYHKKLKSALKEYKRLDTWVYTVDGSTWKKNYSKGSVPYHTHSYMTTWSFILCHWGIITRQTWLEGCVWHLTTMSACRGNNTNEFPTRVTYTYIITHNQHDRMFVRHMPWLEQCTRRITCRSTCSESFAQQWTCMSHAKIHRPPRQYDVRHGQCIAGRIRRKNIRTAVLYWIMLKVIHEINSQQELMIRGCTTSTTVNRTAVSYWNRHISSQNHAVFLWAE